MNLTLLRAAIYQRGLEEFFDIVISHLFSFLPYFPFYSSSRIDYVFTVSQFLSSGFYTPCLFSLVKEKWWMAKAQ
jgi:hypothetical protein